MGIQGEMHSLIWQEVQGEKGELLSCPQRSGILWHGPSSSEATVCSHCSWAAAHST